MGLVTDVSEERTAVVKSDVKLGGLFRVRRWIRHWGLLTQSHGTNKPAISVALLTPAFVMEAAFSSETSATQATSARCQHPKARYYRDIVVKTD
jgi:hypothetical protein